MYQIIECDQRSPEWFVARKGLWTASFFDNAITTTGKKSESIPGVVNRLVAEIILGVPDESFQSEAMLRGGELEDEALNFLNFTHGFNFKKCGFVDSGKGYGCSPDGIDEGNRIGLEMKIPMAHTHIEYISAGHLPKKYKAQVQGSMWVTGFDRWAFFSYHPEIRPLLVIVERDEEYIRQMQDIVLSACTDVAKKLNQVSEYIKE